MVAHRLEALVEAGEKPLAVVAYAAFLPVHDALGAHDSTSERLRYRLVAEADAENGQLARELPYGRERDSGGVRVAGARRDDERLRRKGGDSLGVYLVVPHHLHVCAEPGERVHDVVREGVVVVDHEYHCSSSANLTASNTAFDLLIVSSYSLSGSESATMPAPARMTIEAPSFTSVRITIAKSMSPV